MRDMSFENKTFFREKDAFKRLSLAILAATLISSCSETSDEQVRSKVGSKNDDLTQIVKLAGAFHNAKPTGTDPMFYEQWYFKNTGQSSNKGQIGKHGADIRLSQTKLIPQTDNPIVIAIIDSGIELSHPDLDHSKIHINAGESGFDHAGRNKQSNGIDDDGNGFVDDVHGWNFADNTHSLADSLGHGTHVAGLLAAQAENDLGIANPWRGIQILPVQIFSGRRPTAEAAIISQAIRYAVDRGAKVISASFGTPTPSEELRKAMLYAHAHDVVFVSAVGNMRKNHDLEPSFPAGFHFDNQIAVGAMERRGLPTSFTSFGKTVDLFAPGEEILSLSLNGTYAVRSGTSQACPLVAGAAALTRLLYPGETASEIKSRILLSADERRGLLGFAGEAKSLNVDNIIAGSKGEQQPSFEDSNWKTLAVQIESEHPYRANTKHHVPISLPPGTRAFKIHFRKMTTQSTDILEISDAEGSVVAALSGELEEWWSPIILGERADLHFTTDKYVSDYGWHIDRIEYLD